MSHNWLQSYKLGEETHKLAGHIEWVDTAKGIGCILVILGHLLYKSSYPIINTAIYSFHMPMFFMLSGYVWKNTGTSICRFGKDKFFRIIIPCVICQLLTLAVFWNDIPHNPGYVLKNFLYIDGLTEWNQPAWFFFVYFEIALTERLLKINEKHRFIQIIVCTSAFLIGYVLYRNHIFLKFGIERAFVSLGFYYCGSIFKRLNLNFHENVKIHRIITFLLSLSVWALFGIFLNGKISMYRFTLDNYWYFVVSAISGSICFCMLCSLIKGKFRMFLNYIGKNTIFIILTHYIFIKKIIDVISMKINIQYTGLYLPYSIVCAVILSLAYIPIVKFINKYVPILNGRYYSRRETATSYKQ